MVQECWFKKVSALLSLPLSLSNILYRAFKSHLEGVLKGITLNLAYALSIPHALSFLWLARDKAQWRESFSRTRRWMEWSNIFALRVRERTKWRGAFLDSEREARECVEVRETEVKEACTLRRSRGTSPIWLRPSAHSLIFYVPLMFVLLREIDGDQRIPVTNFPWNFLVSANDLSSWCDMCRFFTERLFLRLELSLGCVNLNSSSGKGQQSHLFARFGKQIPYLSSDCSSEPDVE